MKKMTNGLIGGINMRKLVETLIEIAFKELKESTGKHELEINDIKTLAVAMDKKIDELVQRVTKLENSTSFNNSVENDFYKEYKNGEF